jgi:low affinity Fe/Cu permease
MKRGRIEKLAGDLAAAVTRWSGSSWGFGSALAIVVVWALSGPLFKWSDTWQLVINTGTTIVTFLMVFIIQNAQNRDTRALQIKLDEILEALNTEEGIDIEDLSESELERLQQRFAKLRADKNTEDA